MGRCEASTHSPQIANPLPRGTGEGGGGGGYNQLSARQSIVQKVVGQVEDDTVAVADDEAAAACELADVGQFDVKGVAQRF